MLNLLLREEFHGAHMPGTAIALRNQNNTGAVQQDPQYILSITYPTADVQTALKALSSSRAKHPIVLNGERGRGKSHIMAVMHHTLQSPDVVESWAHEWGNGIGSKVLSEIKIEKGFIPISEPVHNHEYPLLWDLLFDRHPEGNRYRGKFEEAGHPYPSRSLIEKMFEEQPVALILDEFQKWFDGLSDQPGKEGIKYRTWAEAFIQNLSELSRERPDILIFVISVLNNNTEAFRQVHRDSPVLIDFRGPSAKQDRQKLLLYRLFDNRRNIPDSDIGSLTSSYSEERYRLRFSHLSEAEKPRVASEVTACWPFSPELLELLEDHVLMAEAAQETRDLIRILASVFRTRGKNAAILTPADFTVDDDSGGVQSLLDSIATVGEQEKLREIAQRNLETIASLGINIPHARELVSSLWMRSMSPGRQSGGTKNELHLDITREHEVDDNQFDSELVQLIENSINIHGEETPDGRLHFSTEENPRTKVRASAKNDKLWHASATPVTGHTTYPGKDIEHIRNTLKHLLVPETRQSGTRVIVLGTRWDQDPWSEVEERDKPAQWDSPVLIVIPDVVPVSTDGRVAALGRWLVEYVPAKRNTIRFLIPGEDTQGLFEDRELLFCSRCSFLTKIAWRDDHKYRTLVNDFHKPLEDALRKRFDRFAVLRRWDFQVPENCVFDVERVGAQGGDIPSTVEKKIISDLFDPAQFEQFIIERAADQSLVGDVIDELMEPPPPGTGDAIPYLGSTSTLEEILKVASVGKIVVNVKGTWIGRQASHESNDDALRFIRSNAFRSGNEMRVIQLALPTAVGGSTVTGPTPPQPPPVGPLPPGGTGPQPPVEPPVTPPTGPIPPTGPVLIFPKAKRSDEATSGINLSGLFEQWGMPNELTLDSTKIELSGLTVQQVKQILQRLPSSIRASIEVLYNESENES